jgi:DNA modification methylase
MCGDSTDAGDVARFLGNDTIALMATDPPYGVEYESRGKNKRSILGDTIADWGAVWGLWNAPVVYQWHSALFGDIAKAALEREGYEVRQQIVWVKPSFVLGRQAYHWRHENCWYAVKKGHTAQWLGDRTQSTVWEFPSPLAGGHSVGDAEVTSHPTQKPLAVFEIPIRNHCGPEDIVADPFLGSGTAMIAAERLGRVCLGMELDPKWGTVALERWERYSGLEAAKISCTRGNVLVECLHQ